MPQNNEKISETPECTIRPSTLEDLERIYLIETMSFPEPYPFGLLHQLIKDQNAISLTIEIEQNIVGYAMGIMRPGKKGHIVTIAVHPQYRNCNYGHLLIAQLVSELKAKGAIKLELEVRVSNKIALKLYEKFNFKIKKTIYRYYSNGEDAYLMVCETL